MLSSVLTFWTKDGPPIVWHSEPRDTYRSRVRGCLLGGALGDALGAPVEFSTLAQIRAAHGPAGVRSHVDPRALVTDDTQMTLWTVDGLIRARVRQAVHGGEFDPTRAVHDAYLRWYHTQFVSAPTGEHPGWLAARSWLYHQRAPGRTCLQALQDAVGGRQERGAPASNGSKGCGGVMQRPLRPAPRPRRHRHRRLRLGGPGRGAHPRPPHRTTSVRGARPADPAAAGRGRPRHRAGRGAHRTARLHRARGDYTGAARRADRGCRGRPQRGARRIAGRRVDRRGSARDRGVRGTGPPHSRGGHRRPRPRGQPLRGQRLHRGDLRQHSRRPARRGCASPGPRRPSRRPRRPAPARRDLLLRLPGPPTTAEWLARYPAD